MHHELPDLAAKVDSTADPLLDVYEISNRCISRFPLVGMPSWHGRTDMIQSDDKTSLELCCGENWEFDVLSKL
jgi:hypothetical protein